MNILDLFCGAGGFSLGFEKEGFHTVVAVDMDDSVLETFKLNFPQSETLCGDLTDNQFKKRVIKKARELNVNMIIGGPPCQGFSLQGKKLGLNDKRNFLFLEYVDIVKSIKPEIFVLENVKNMINAENGYFIKQIVKEFEKLGYYVDYKVLNAKDYGVPQNRERAFVVGSKKHKIILDPQKKETVTVKDAISDLFYLNSGEGEYKQEYTISEKSDYQKQLRIKSKFLYNHQATNHKKIAIDKLKLIPKEEGKEHLPKNMLGRQKFSSTWGRLKWNDVSPTIDTRFDTPSNGTNSHPELHRAITPREAARLQSFPDSFVFVGTKTSICKQIGNAVPPLLAQAIARDIKSLDYKVTVNSHGTMYCEDSFLIYDKVGEVDHIITDPPYNISKSNNLNTMKGNRQGVDFGEWDKDFDLLGWLDLYVPKVKPGGSIIIFCSYLYVSYLCDKLESLDCNVKDVIRWVKKNPMPRNIQRRYVLDNEIAIWAVKSGAKWVFNNGSGKYLRPEYSTAIVSGKEKVKHPTQKSLELMEQLIQVHTNKNDLVLDPFAGSGTTCVACQNTNRKFLGIEINKNFFKIATNRLKNRKDDE